MSYQDIPDSELDYHYSPSRWSHRMSSPEVMQAHGDFATAATREAQWCLDVEAGISYGDSERQQMDVYTKKDSAGMKGSPIFVFLHGGYWQEKFVKREICGFMAQPFTAAGATVIVLDYELCPDVTMDEILSEIKQAMYFIFKLAKERHSKGIYLCGHSTGAHLAAMMLSSSFQDDDAFDSELIKGAILISGVYDLRPLVKTEVNIPLRLTEEDAWRFSPLNFVSDIAHRSAGRKILIAVGEFDPPSFRSQSADFEQAVRKCGIQTRYMELSDTDHFSVVEKLSQAKYSLTKECLRLMDL